MTAEMRDTDVQGFTAAQLVQLKQQISSLHQINFRLKVACQSASQGTVRRRGGSARGRGGRVAWRSREMSSRGRGRGRKARAREIGEDDELVESAKDSSESETEASTDTEDMEADEATPELSDVSEDGELQAPEDTCLLVPNEVRRRSSRSVGRPQKPLVDLSDVDDEDLFSRPTKPRPQSTDCKIDDLQRYAKWLDSVKAQRKSHAATEGLDTRCLPEMEPLRVIWPGEEHATCTVCGFADSVEQNPILLCEKGGCSTAVHISCYGLRSVPEGIWFCDLCADGNEPDIPACRLCPVAGGALRRILVQGHVSLPKGSSPWAHLACALWTPEIRFVEPERLLGLDISDLEPRRLQLSCVICKNAGAVVRCPFEGCDRGVHVICGRITSCDLTFMADGTPLVFCDVHSKPRYKEVRQEMKGADDDLEADIPSVEPTDYELQRQKNLERIEAAKRAMLSPEVADH